MILAFVFCDHTSGTGKSQDGAVLTPDILGQIEAAVSKQLSGEFAAEWGGSYTTRLGKSDGSDVAAPEIEIAIFQNEDVSGAAGYHDRSPNGQAYIHVCLDDSATLTTGPGALSVIASHECCETAADTPANRWADRQTPIEEALETCDRVEDQSYTIDAVAVSDFLHRSAFDPGSSGPWDHMGVLTTEDGITPQGYAIERKQGAEIAAARTESGITLTFKHHASVKRGPGKMSSAQWDRYLRRKNHPASRTRRRGATME